MPSITDQLQNAAPRNEELLAILSETGSVPQALEQQKSYIKDLDGQLRDVKKRIGVLEKEKSKELKDHEKYRDSVMKRWAYKVTGKEEKFAAKAEKEEKEYFDVLQKLHQATDLDENLKDMRSRAVAVQGDMELDVQRHKTAQEELDSLYTSIFQGPTPSFPEEDDAERRVEMALQAYNSTCATVAADRKVWDLLQEANKRISGALLDIEDALNASRLDMFGGGSTADMMERSCLHKAEMNVTQAQMLLMQAQHIVPSVEGLPPVKIAQGNIMSDVLFDNIFSDMEFHEKIKQSRVEVERCHKAVQAQIMAAKERSRISGERSNTESGLLSTARNDLQKTRQVIFERLAKGDITDTPPIRSDRSEGLPAYS